MSPWDHLLHSTQSADSVRNLFGKVIVEEEWGTDEWTTEKESQI